MPPAGGGRSPRTLAASPPMQAGCSARAPRRGVHDQHVTGSAVTDVGRHRPEKPTGEAVEPAVADHAQVGIAVLGELDQHVDGVARLAGGVDLRRTGLLCEVGRLAQDVFGGVRAHHLVGLLAERVRGPALVALVHLRVRRRDEQVRAAVSSYLSRALDSAERRLGTVGPDKDRAVGGHPRPFVRRPWGRRYRFAPFRTSPVDFTHTSCPASRRPARPPTPCSQPCASGSLSRTARWARCSRTTTSGSTTSRVTRVATRSSTSPDPTSFVPSTTPTSPSAATPSRPTPSAPTSPTSPSTASPTGSTSSRWRQRGSRETWPTTGPRPTIRGGASDRAVPARSCPRSVMSATPSCATRTPPKWPVSSRAAPTRSWSRRRRTCS